jgi:hypothetical protein
MSVEVIYQAHSRRQEIGRKLYFAYILDFTDEYHSWHKIKAVAMLSGSII